MWRPRSSRSLPVGHENMPERVGVFEHGKIVLLPLIAPGHCARLARGQRE
jgi:hypothetical protein